MPKDHYVSEWQIKRWLASKEKKVRVYDTRADRFSWASPRALFAVKDLNSPDLERRLEQLVETPLTSGATSPLRARPASAGVMQAANWRVFRAAWLFMFLQGPRTGSSIAGESSVLGGLLARPEHELDALCYLLDRQRKLVWFRHREPRLFLPSIGYFAVPVHDPGCVTGFGIAQAIPLDPSTALLMMSKTARLSSGAPHTLDHRKALPILSVGSGEHVKVLVVPPAVAAAYRTREQESQLRNLIAEQRRTAHDILHGIQEIRRIQHDALQRLGAQVSRVPGLDQYVIRR